jgi:hypothetical protein
MVVPTLPDQGLEGIDDHNRGDPEDRHRTAGMLGGGEAGQHLHRDRHELGSRSDGEAGRRVVIGQGEYPEDRTGSSHRLGEEMRTFQK